MTSYQRIILFAGSVFGGLAVMLGAFGAHALKAVLLAHNKQDAYETAVRYQFYHALALLLLGTLMRHISNQKLIQLTVFCWVGGILLFSGSLYALSLSGIIVFAFLTPVGGVLLLAGWAFLVWAILKNKKGTEVPFS
jgi:uncharacterized membrane protein YgdD (TMEM256/DUF423 family)